jgi:hypothetical protein
MQFSFRPHISTRSASVVAAAIASSVVLVSTLPATAAHEPAAATAIQVSVTRPVGATKLPNSKIEWNGKTHIYTPKSLKATWSGSSEKKCTAAKQRITISNVTKNTQSVTYEGAFLVSLPAGYQFGACFWGTGVGSFDFGVDKSKAELTVSVS